MSIRISATEFAFDPDDHHPPAGTYEFTLVTGEEEHELQLGEAGQHDTHLAVLGPVAPGGVGLARHRPGAR